MTAKQKAARAKFKAIVKEASKLRKKNPKLTQAQAVKQAWAISYSKKRAGVGAVKKKSAPTKVKAKKRAATEMHTDTKSHNVNIRVVSGIDKNDITNKFIKLNSDIQKLENILIRNKETQKKPPYKTDFWKRHFSYQNKLVKQYISELKKHKAELKKLM